MTDLIVPVSLRSISGERVIVRVPSSSSVGTVREAAAEFLKCDKSDVTMIFKRTELNDTSPVYSLGLTDDSFIIVLKKAPRPVARNSARSQPSKSGHFAHFDKSGREVPVNVRALVKFLMNLHFSESHACAALEFTGYDLPAAVALLTKGKTLASETNASKHHGTEPPRPAPAVDGHDLRLVNISSEDQRKLDEAVKSFTEEQHLAIQRLTNRHHDHMTVIQVYLACDKDENATAACLQTMQ